MCLYNKAMMGIVIKHRVSNAAEILGQKYEIIFKKEQFY